MLFQKKKKRISILQQKKISFKRLSHPSDTLATASVAADELACCENVIYCVMCDNCTESNEGEDGSHIIHLLPFTI